VPLPPINDLTIVLRRLTEAGLLSKELGSGHDPNTYRLHLPRVLP
jgi:hypothetical protein